MSQKQTRFSEGKTPETKTGIKIVKGKACEPFEYLCKACGQLRLSLVITNVCGNCESTRIIKGRIGSLTKGG